MPSRKNKGAVSRKTSKKRSGSNRSVSRSEAVFATAHPLFIPLIIFVFIMWTVYRTTFTFPVWFDESIGKALFFGLPVWIFVSVTGTVEIAKSVSLQKFKPGVLQGLAFGGIFGFAATIATLLSRSQEVIPVPLFSSGVFWSEFALAALTGFWESVFFFGFIMLGIQLAWSHWTLLKQVVVTAAIFALFHVPNIFVQYLGSGVSGIAGYIFLVTAFGVGQAFLFARNRNLYTLMVVHAIWGMTLFIHTI